MIKQFVRSIFYFTLTSAAVLMYSKLVVYVLTYPNGYQDEDDNENDDDKDNDKWIKNIEEEEKKTTPDEKEKKDSSVVPGPVPVPVQYENKYTDQWRSLPSSGHFNPNLSEEEQRNVLDRFKNNVIIEKTPLGNVAMYYNPEKESFEYYSDNTIPYRYLETVGRRYTIFFQCKDLFIDIKEELENQAAAKAIQEKEEKDSAGVISETGESIEGDETNTSTATATATVTATFIPPSIPTTSSTKKSVFAKLKNPHGIPTNSSRSTTEQDISKQYPPINISKSAQPAQPAPAPTNQPSSAQSSDSQNSVIKERSNRYICKGRFSNLNLLKTIKKEEVDPNYQISFKDFKKKFIETKSMVSRE